MIGLNERWTMEETSKGSGTAKQGRSLEIFVRGNAYVLNIDEARALHREIGRMVRNVDRAAPLPKTETVIS